MNPLTWVGRGADTYTVRRAARALLYLGTAAAVLALGKYHAAAIGNYDFTGSARFAWSLAYVGLLGLAAYGLGLPDLARTWKVSALSAALATTGAAAALSFVQLLVGSALLPRFVVLGVPLALVPWYMTLGRVVAGSRSRSDERDRVALVGGLDEQQAVRDELAADPERGALLATALQPAEAAAARPRVRPLVEAVVRGRANVVVLDREAQADESVVAQAAVLHENGVRVRTLSLFYDEWLGKLPLGELERVGLMFDIGELHRARYGRVKRLMDLVAAVAGALVLAVLLPFVVIGNVVANRGPLLYRQPRMGRNGDVFAILKLRTMRPGATGDDESGDGAWTRVDDSRVTPFGRVLRRSHLDELPQVLNVLRGDLSIIGPRPEQPRYVAELVQKIPFYDLRHRVRPGLTGWAQVKYAYGASELDAMEKLQYEFFYLRHQSLALDLRIVGRTLRSVLGRGGR